MKHSLARSISSQHPVIQPARYKHRLSAARAFARSLDSADLPVDVPDTPDPVELGGKSAAPKCPSRAASRPGRLRALAPIMIGLVAAIALQRWLAAQLDDELAALILMLTLSVVLVAICAPALGNDGRDRRR